MRIHSIILFCVLIILVECADYESEKNLSLFRGLLEHILKKFVGEKKASTSNNYQLCLSYKTNADMLSIIEEKIANKFLNADGECHDEMKIHSYEILSESGLFKKSYLVKKEISPEGNIQVIKFLLSFAIRLISIVGEYELNQNLLKGSKEIKLTNFLVAYNCLDEVITNAQMKRFSGSFKIII